MGYGDYLMALGDAWTLHARDALRRPVAIGDGRRVDDPYPELRHGLHFVASQATVDSGQFVHWVHSWRAHRPYHDYAAMRRIWEKRHPLRRRLLGSPDEGKLVRRLGHYVFNASYSAVAAPLVLDEVEQAIFEHWSQRPFVVIEPHIKDRASPSKRWPFERYAQVAEALSREIEVYQAGAVDSPSLNQLPRLPTRRFRDVLPYLKAAQLYIGPEGGLHHASAAMGTRAVVIYGGYTPPSATGYDLHVNLTGGATACGTQMSVCTHCVEAMDRIGADEVIAHARRLLAASRPVPAGVD